MISGRAYTTENDMFLHALIIPNCVVVIPNNPINCWADVLFKSLAYNHAL